MDYKVACSLARKLAVRPPTVVDDGWPAPTLRVEFPFKTVTIEPYLKTLDGKIGCTAVAESGARYGHLTALMLKTMIGFKKPQIGIDLFLGLSVEPTIAKRNLCGWVQLTYLGRSSTETVALSGQPLWDAIHVMRGEMPGQAFLDLLMDQYLGDTDRSAFSLILERYWRDRNGGES